MANHSKIQPLVMRLAREKSFRSQREGQQIIETKTPKQPSFFQTLKYGPDPQVDLSTYPNLRSEGGYLSDSEQSQQDWNILSDYTSYSRDMKKKKPKLSSRHKTLYPVVKPCQSMKLKVKSIKITNLRTSTNRFR